MTDMKTRETGENLSAYHERFMTLSRARKWIHDLHNAAYEPDSKQMLNCGSAN
jgi:hypothetical protein